MEEVIDFDEWFKKQVDIVVQYYLIYDSETGEVKSLSPDYACTDLAYKIPISQEMAEDILAGNLNPSLIKVNLDLKELEILEDQSIEKIESLIYRIPHRADYDKKDIDVCIRYYKQDKTLVFELTKKFGGTFDNNELEKDNIREPFWENDLSVDYMIGDLNDPNILHDTISVKISEMIGNPVVFEQIDLPENFSIYYTKRILRNHVYEVL